MSRIFENTKKWLTKRFGKKRIPGRNLLPGGFAGVSPLHYYEARERFFLLIDMIRLRGMKIGLELPFSDDHCQGDYDEAISEAKTIISELGDSDDDTKTKDQCYTLLACYESLIASMEYLNQNKGDLNRLWRTMTRVHSRLIGIVVNKEKQSEQLYFCQEEAYRMGLESDPKIKPMLQDLAEYIDTEGSRAPSPKYKCVLCALLERFNTIRAGRIHQQNLNVKTYLKAFGMLMIISTVLIYNYDLIMKPGHSPALKNEDRKEASQISPSTAMDDPKSAEDSRADHRGSETAELGIDKIEHRQIVNTGLISGISQGVAKGFHALFDFIYQKFKHNLFFFVFFGGLTGGVFSLATKSRRVDREHGEDVYASVYVLTKPFIGALGAVVLYIFVHTNFLTQNLVEKDMIDYLKTPGAVTFGFAFISGFSERLVFPKFR